MSRAQEPAQNESERIVNDDPLNLLGEALLLVLVMFSHPASPEMNRQRRWPLHDLEGDLEAPGGTLSRLSGELDP